MSMRARALGLLTLIGASAVAGAASASDTAVQLSPRLGLGTLHIGKQYTLSGNEENLDSVGLGIELGVVTPIGLMFEGGIQGHSNFSYFGADDRYELTYQNIMVGYQFETPHGFRIVPKVGRMRWKLYDKEGRLFHPGPEAENTKIGYENFWEVTLQKRVGRRAALGVSFRDNNFDFGSAQAIMFTATFDM